MNINPWTARMSTVAAIAIMTALDPGVSRSAAAPIRERNPHTAVTAITQRKENCGASIG